MDQICRLGGMRSPSSNVDQPFGNTQMKGVGGDADLESITGWSLMSWHSERMSQERGQNEPWAWKMILKYGDDMSHVTSN